MNGNLSFFGVIAVSMGLITDEELDVAIKIQEELLDAGEKKQLGDILKTAGHISATDIEIILAMQQTYDSVTEETRYGELAVVNGLVNQEQIDNALALQKGEMEGKTVGDILVELKQITPFQNHAILQSQERLRKAYESQRAG